MKKNQKTILFGLVALMVLVLGFLGYQKVSAWISQDTPTQTAKYQNFLFFASTTNPTQLATTTSATSTDIAAFFDTDGRLNNGYFVIAGAKEVLLYFQRGEQNSSGNVGTSTFNIQVTPNGTDWFNYNQLRNATSTISSANELSTLVGTSTIRAATTTNIFKMETLGWFGVRCILVETTDGSHTCKASASW